MAIDITTTAHGPTTPAGSGELVAATKAIRRNNERWFEVALLGGLAGVFLVNALVAWLQPSDFVDLVKRSTLADLAPFDTGRWLVWVIGLNDLALGVLLVIAIRRRSIRPPVLAWSGVWLLAVTVVKVTSLDVLAS
jgi:hypothetical protein